MKGRYLGHLSRSDPLYGYIQRVLGWGLGWLGCGLLGWLLGWGRATASLSYQIE